MANSGFSYVETSVHKRMLALAITLAELREIGIIKGHVGIGKTEAINWIENNAGALGIEITRITATQEIGNNVRGFCNRLLAPLGLQERDAPSAVDALAKMLNGWSSSHRLLIVDESQNIAANVLEMLRGLWDWGYETRFGENPNQGCFGLMLIGNDTMFTRSGNLKFAEYPQIMSRVMIMPETFELSGNDLIAILEAHHITNSNALEKLKEIGLDHRDIRMVEKIVKFAKRLAQSDDVRIEHINSALELRKGIK